MIKNYTEMFKSIDSSQIAYFIIFIISIVGIIVYNKDKGGVKRIVDKIGDIIAAVLLMPITVMQIALQICIDAITIVLTVITGVCIIVINVIRLIKQVIDELTRLLIKGYKDKEDVE